MLNINADKLINRNNRVLVKRLATMLETYGLKVNAAHTGIDFIRFRIDSTDYGIKILKNKVVLAWNRPFMPEKTVREFNTLSGAISDLDTCLRYHNYLSNAQE